MLTRDMLTDGMTSLSGQSVVSVCQCVVSVCVSMGEVGGQYIQLVAVSRDD